jgi:membrane-bound lytic murein transglycosylase B
MRRWLQFLVFLITFTWLGGAFAAAGDSIKSVDPDWKYVERRLKLKKFDKAFIAEMKKIYEPKDFIQVLELNMLLYLRSRDYHGTQVTDQAANEVRAFMEENRDSLKSAEKKMKVSGSVVASLLWIESRHGKNQGRFNVPSVYLSLLQANRKPVLRYLKSAVPRYADDPHDPRIADLQKRAKKKSDWAMEQLQALAKAYKWKWHIVSDLRGSFSGAFGMPQFIPTSYVKWARSPKPKAAPDLMSAPDAIQSVAYYLHDQGWKPKKEKTHVPALMKYNNSEDYANAILALAAKADEGRRPASQSSKTSKGSKNSKRSKASKSSKKK